MHPSISLFPNNRFYDGQILNGPNVLKEGYNNNYMDFKYGSYAFVHIADGREENDEVGKSWLNWVEVAVIEHLVKNLYESTLLCYQINYCNKLCINHCILFHPDYSDLPHFHLVI